jgi:hypothetical protein
LLIPDRDWFDDAEVVESNDFLADVAEPFVEDAG